METQLGENKSMKQQGLTNLKQVKHQLVEIAVLLFRFKGDKAIFFTIILLMSFSAFPVYSAASQLSLVLGYKTPWFHLRKHFFLCVFGVIVMIVLHHYPLFKMYLYKRLMQVLVLITFVLVAFSSFKGTVIQGANASRWISLGLFSLQPSVLALILLPIYTVSYLKDGVSTSLKQDWLPYWIPIGLTICLIFVADFSTAIIIMVTLLWVLKLGGYPWGRLGIMFAVTVGLLGIFLLFIKAFPDAMPHRVDTWKSRIEKFTSGEDGYQVKNAKAAIAGGGMMGRGFGKSVEKNFVPQSASDFIFAIIVEEFGWGSFLVLLVYSVIFFRFLLAIVKSDDAHQQLIIFALAFPMIVQTVVNLMVAVGMIPVTGQNLPFISTGGTSIVLLSFSMAIVLHITAEQKRKLEKERQQKKDTKNASSEEATSVLPKNP